MHRATYPALDLTVSSEHLHALDFEDRLYAVLDSLSPIAIQEDDSGDRWRVFFSSSVDRHQALLSLRDELGAELDRIEPVDVPDEDWARRSQAALTAVRIGRLIVAPPWDRPEATVSTSLTAGAGDIVIEIDPSMGFGTGHHATTRLCLTLLQQQSLTNARVIDVGSGSGVLAIAASLLGAAAVVAIDHDPDALANARENVRRNHVRVDIREADLQSLGAGRFDLVLANLTAAVIVRHRDALSRLLAPGGLMILSGFSADDAGDVAGAFAVEPLETVVEGDWAAMLLQRGARNFSSASETQSRR